MDSLEFSIHKIRPPANIDSFASFFPQSGYWKFIFMALIEEMWALEWKDENPELIAAAKAVWAPALQLASLYTRQVRVPQVPQSTAL